MGKLGLWALVRGIYPPNDEWIDRLEELDLGYYVGGDENYFYYNNLSQVPDISEDELWNIYQQMKHDSKA